jgi:MFS family permease
MKKSEISRSEKIIETRKRNSRRLSIYDASAFSVSDGFGIRNIAPYALALNASNSMMGFLVSIPSLLGNLSQLLTYKLMGNHSRKKLVVSAVFIQAFFWLLLLLPGFLFLRAKTATNTPVIILIALYTGLIVSGALAGPAWMSWMKDIVPEKKLGRYFAKRNKIAGSIAFGCMIIAGLLLDYFKSIEVLYGFFILLFISFLFRSISGNFVRQQYEPKFRKKKEHYFSFGQFLSNIKHNNFGRFVIFISLMNFSIAIASPFFAVYLLREKQLSYTLYMALTVLMPIASIITMSYWGKISDSVGNVKILRITGIGIAFIPFVYFISNFISTFWIFIGFLALLEIFAGINWGGFNLSVSNFLFKTVSREKMILCSSYMNMINGITIFVGATIGGLIASVPFWNPILIVFLVSGIGRLVVYLSILPKLKEKAHESSVYDKKDLIANLNFAPRFFNPIGGINYAVKITKKIGSIGRIKLF